MTLQYPKRMPLYKDPSFEKISRAERITQGKAEEAWKIVQFVRKIISISLSSKLKLPYACAGTKPQAARYPHARVCSHQ